MSEVDHGIAGAIGAALASGAYALKRLLSGDKRIDAPPPIPGPTAQEFAALTDRVNKMETAMRDITASVDRLRQELDRLTESNDKTDDRLDTVRMTAAKLEAIVERMERLERRREN